MKGNQLRFPVTLERGEDDYIVAECLALPGCVSQGRTEEEALANITDAINGILAVRQKHGLPIPEVHRAEDGTGIVDITLFTAGQQRSGQALFKTGW
ncbi:MAG: type II toxin-antitoxin system HicB family antitoxin [Dehalococcoidia bacterium]